MKIIVMAFFLLLAMAGSFVAGNYYFTGNMGPLENNPAADILEEAKKAVPPVVLPPKPAGRSVTTNQQISVQVPDVRIENKMVSVGPLKTLVPQVVTTMKTVTTTAPTTTLVDATPEEIAVWNQQVKELEDKYQEAINEKVLEITQERQKERATQIMTATKGVFTDMIIPLITAMTGLIGAMAAFKYGTKPSA